MTSVPAHMDCTCLGFHVVGEERRERCPQGRKHTGAGPTHRVHGTQQSVRLRRVVDFV